MKTRNSDGREVLIEMYYTNSRSVRIVALDPITGIEVTMIGDKARGEAALKRAAAQKLHYVINKKLGK